MEALAIRAPASAETFLALYEFARASHDDALARRAGERLLALAPRHASMLEADVPALRPLPRLDAALRADDLPRARRVAQTRTSPSTEVALRAPALGRVSAGAQPSPKRLSGRRSGRTSARGSRWPSPPISRAISAALGEASACAPAQRGAWRRAISPLARLLFAELLDRRLGAEAGAPLARGRAPPCLPTTRWSSAVEPSACALPLEGAGAATSPLPSP
jgi:hypothetical protein